MKKPIILIFVAAFAFIALSSCTNSETPATPEIILIPFYATSIAGGASHSLALKNDGTLWATGFNWTGQLGTGDNSDRNVFVQVLSGVSEMAGGYEHSIALKDDGTLWATGKNDFGQLGTGDNDNRNEFVHVLSGVNMTACGYDHSIALKDDGTLWATGWNGSGAFGTGDNNDRNIWTQIYEH